MLIQLRRVTKRPDARERTFSNWFVDGELMFAGLELPIAPPPGCKLHAMPVGKFRVRMTRSNKFSKRAGVDVYLPQIFDRPGVVTMFGGKPVDVCGLRLHSGNVVNAIPFGLPGGPRVLGYDAADPNRTDSDGCPLVGLSFTGDGKSITRGRDAQKLLIRLIEEAAARGELVELEVS
jgi:hypothetical protein